MKQITQHHGGQIADGVTITASAVYTYLASIADELTSVIGLFAGVCTVVLLVYRIRVTRLELKRMKADEE